MGTAWIVLAATDLNDYSAGAKVNALRTAALAAGQTDPFPRVMADVVALVRSQIASCKRNQISATASSIPPAVKSQAAWLVIQAMQGRLPGLKLTDEERGMIKNAEDFLAKVASCDYLVEIPLDPLVPSPYAMGGSVEVTDGVPVRTATRAKMDGL